MLVLHSTRPLPRELYDAYTRRYPAADSRFQACWLVAQ